MSLVDIRFIEFSGDPLGGRRHARLVTYTDQLTRPEFAALHEEFNRFCTGVQNSVAQYLVSERLLPDGMRMRFIANSGHFDVHVWPVRAAEEHKEPKLPHAFVVNAPWCRDSYFCRKPEGPEWNLAPDTVMQLDATPWSADQNLRRAGAAGAMYTPTVHERHLWEHWSRKCPEDVLPLDGKEVLAVSLRKPAGTYAGWPDFAYENLIVDRENVTKFTSSLLSPILGGDPEEPVMLPPATTSEGTRAILQHWREAVISETFNIWTFRVKAEVVALTGDGSAYASLEVVSAEFTLPIGVTIPSPASFDTLGIDLGEQVFYYTLTAEAGFSASNPGCGASGTRSAFLGVEITKVREMDPFRGWTTLDDELALREVHEPDASEEVVGADSTQLDEVLVLPGRTAEHVVSATISHHYPLRTFWRGGYKREYLDTLVYMYPPSYAGVHDFVAWRVDTNMSVDYAPIATFDLEWLPTFAFFEGSANGTITGQEYRDVKGTNHTVSFAEAAGIGGGARDYATSQTGPIPPGVLCVGGPYDGYTDTGPIWGWFAGVNEQHTYQKYLDDYPQSTFVQTVHANTRPENLVNYEFTSRHIIDYDHRGQFYAAIRVEVTSSGAKQTESADPVEGVMEVAVEPTYNVRILFETKWATQPIDEVVLYDETHTRPGFEFLKFQKANVFWKGVLEGNVYDYPIVVHMPPAITPRPEAMRQLKAVARNQAFNTNLTVQDQLDDPKFNSKKGIEYSTETAPHRRQPTGQLYARTFTVGDFGDALWLLHATKCSVDTDGETEGTYDYMPGFTTFLSEEHHIEVRDGVIEQWTDEIPPKPDEVRPDPVDRDIKLYRV